MVWRVASGAGSTTSGHTSGPQSSLTPWLFLPGSSHADRSTPSPTKLSLDRPDLGSNPNASLPRQRWIPTRSATPSTALVPQRKVGFPIPSAGLLLGFQGTKTARREGISSPFSDAGGCTSPQNSGAVGAASPPYFKAAFRCLNA